MLPKALLEKQKTNRKNAVPLISSDDLKMSKHNSQ